MVRARNSGENKDRDMAEAGARFETYIRAAMDEVGLPTWAELYRQSGMGASTWGPWFRGESAPRYNSMKLAGLPLHRTPEQLLAAWAGEKAHRLRKTTQTPDPLVSALQRQSEAIEGLIAELRFARTGPVEPPRRPPGELPDRKPPPS